MRIKLKILTALWISFWLFLSVDIIRWTPRLIQNNKEIINRDIKPSVEFVKKFKSDNQRLPTDVEFSVWKRNNYLSAYSMRMIHINDDDGKVNETIRKQNFTISYIDRWSRKQRVIYSSRKGTYVSCYSWKKSFKELAVMIGIGILPLLFWWLENRRRKKVTLKFAEIMNSNG